VVGFLFIYLFLLIVFESYCKYQFSNFEAEEC
jgi:hypothetical protein